MAKRVKTTSKLVLDGVVYLETTEGKKVTKDMIDGKLILRLVKAALEDGVAREKAAR